MNNNELTILTIWTLIYGNDHIWTLIYGISQDIPFPYVVTHIWTLIYGDDHIWTLIYGDDHMDTHIRAFQGYCITICG